MPKTMKQMKAIVKTYLTEKVRLKRAAVAAHQDALVARLVTVHADLVERHRVTLDHRSAPHRRAASVDSIVVQQQAAIAAHQAASIVVYQAAVAVQQQNAIAAHQAALSHANSIVARHQAALQARLDQASQDRAHDEYLRIVSEFDTEESESDL